MKVGIYQIKTVEFLWMTTEMFKCGYQVFKTNKMMNFADKIQE